MNNFISFYKKRFNLTKAIFLPIEHEEAMVAIVYKVIFNSKTFILKICPRTEDYFREVYFLKFFAKVLPVPNIIQEEQPSPTTYGAILMEYLPGNLLKPEALTDKLAYEIGVILASIHLNRLESYGDLTQPQNLSSDSRVPFTHKFVESVSECNGHLPQRLLDKAQQYYDGHINLLRLVDGPCIIHRDFRPGNTMILNGELTGIIDWASARASFAEEDFSPLELNEWSSNSQLKKSFLSGYASVRPVPNYKQIMPLLRLNRVCATIGFTIKQATWNNKHTALYQANRQYLETFLNSSTS